MAPFSHEAARVFELGNFMKGGYGISAWAEIGMETVSYHNGCGNMCGWLARIEDFGSQGNWNSVVPFAEDDK